MWLVAVSIHAPARGATTALEKDFPDLDEFQSTRPHGARPDAITSLAESKRFNPRARTGRDISWNLHPSGNACRFNPRARTGRDIHSPHLA